MPTRASVLMVGLIITASIAAIGANGDPRSQAPDSATKAQSATLVPADARKDPYRLLFNPRPRPRDAHASRASQRPAESPSPRDPRVVCGTLIIPTDPSVDPGIVIPLPDTTKFAMRVKPPACQTK